MSRKKLPTVATKNDVFAVRLREMMKRRGETQLSLANKITERYGKIQRQTIAAYTQGINKPNTEYLARIAAVLDVSADYLIGINDRPTLNESKKAMMEYTGLSESAVVVLHKQQYKQACGSLLISKNFERAMRALNDCMDEKTDLSIFNFTREAIKIAEEVQPISPSRAAMLDVMSIPSGS